MTRMMIASVDWPSASDIAAVTARRISSGLGAARRERATDRLARAARRSAPMPLRFGGGQPVR
jgi:hypothetical protein